MNQVETEVINIDNKEYVLIDSINDGKNIYNYFFDSIEKNNVQVLKEITENNEKLYSSVDNDHEYDYALTLFYEKYKNDLTDKTTNN